MKRSMFAFAGAIALLATAAAPVLAATSLDVPAVASAPSLDPNNGASFASAAVAKLSGDAQTANQPASVRIERDNTALYVRFDVTQTDPMMGSDGGDSVAVDLWPAGNESNRYRLGVNLDGSHTSDSTANTAGWQASVATHGGSYTVTMKIPIDVVSGSASTRVQFSRWIASTGEQQLWSHESAGAGDVANAGTLTLSTVSKN